MTLIRREAFKRAEIIDDEMGWDSGLAIGKLARLWDTSQEDEGVSVVRRRQIGEWARVKPEDLDRFIELCCKTGPTKDEHIHFLARRDDGRYSVVGNPEAIVAIKKVREQKSLAGKASAEARKAETGSAVPTGAVNHPSRIPPAEQTAEQTAEQPFERPSEQTTERGFEQTAEQRPNSFTSVLVSSSESAESSPDPGEAGPPVAAAPPPAAEPAPEKPPATKKPKPPGPDGRPVWEAYREAYAGKYGHDPVRNVRVNSQCSQLVSRLGAEAAVKVVRFYLTHGSSWYVRCVHALGPCLQDCEALHTQMLAGHRVSSTEAQRVDKNQGNAQAFAAVAAKFAAEGKL